MLVLTRKINEEIFIGSDITIKIVSSSEGLVKIGINAPRSVQVYRKEVYDRVKQQTIEASKASIQTIVNLQNFKIKKV
jgi:carbon storage regulator